VALWVDPERVPPEGVSDLLRLPERLAALPAASSRARGRGTVWRWEPGWLGGRRVVVRQFVHGGALGGLRGTLFWGARSMLHELRVAAHALAAGVPTARPIALRVQRVLGPLVTGHYLTEEVPGAEDLLALCRRGDALVKSAGRRQAVARAVASVVAALHDAGISHGDLNLRNLLISARHDPPRVHVIDFKKARLHTEVTLREGLRNLVRLDRSVVKWPASRRAITRADRLRTLRQYVRLRGGAGADWKQVARAVRTTHLPHALSREGRA